MLDRLVAEEAFFKPDFFWWMVAPIVNDNSPVFKYLIPNLFVSHERKDHKIDLGLKYQKLVLNTESRKITRINTQQCFFQYTITTFCIFHIFCMSRNYNSCQKGPSEQEHLKLLEEYPSCLAKT